MTLKERLKRIVVAYTYDGKPVTANDVHAAGAMAALLKDAIKPNLVQTLEHVPALVHGGPFANIAHGCNSVMATQTALRLAEYTITEAGFGADLGAEKFFDIKSRFAGLHPDACVIVATVRALKMHGGVPKDKLKEPNVDAVRAGLENLGKHIENVFKFGVPSVVAINIFAQDTKEELQAVYDYCQGMGVEVALSDVFAKGGEGGIELAKEVVKLAEGGTAHFAPIYPLDMPLKQKIETIAKEIYGAGKVQFEPKASQVLDQYQAEGYGTMPVCMAKTQNSLSDNPNLKGRRRTSRST
jgi:formate--tetrahydrofolate ligase